MSNLALIVEPLWLIFAQLTFIVNIVKFYVL